MDSKNVNNSSEMVWYLDKPQVKEVSTTEKLQRMPKLRYNPFTYAFALGFSGAVGSFSYGVYISMAKLKVSMEPNARLQHDLKIYRMMQLRVGFQAIAIASVLGGVWYFQRQVEKLQEQRLE